MADEKKEIKPVVKGRIKEKSLGDKAAEAFLSEDTRNVKNYIVWDVLIPGIKNAIADVVIGGIEMALFGSTRGSRRSSSNTGRSHVSYNTCYDSDRDDRRARVGRSDRTSKYDFSDILLDTRGDAEEVISSMEELVDRYHEATVMDLCQLVGVESRHTDNKWGWTDCRDFHYRRSGRGFVLDFAPPIYLD